MKRLTLVVDERELSTIQAALLLLQEQINALPEDLAEMLSTHVPAMTEKEIGKLAQRLAEAPKIEDFARRMAPRRRYAVEVEQFGSAPVGTG